MMDWQSEIFMATLVKQQVADADRAGLWRHPLPEPGAAESELVEVERALGYALDPDFRCFLGHSNGWPSFYRDIDLLAARQLLAGPARDRARVLLKDPRMFNELSGYDLDDLLPIAVSANGRDVFLLASAHALLPGVVFWITGQVVDSFDDFAAWFLAMVDYNRRDQARLQSLE
jgi:hypothetical protein